MADITSLIARPPQINFDQLGDPFKSYTDARNQRTAQDMQEARKMTLANLPRAPDGTPDLQEAAIRLGAIGDMQGLTELTKLADARATRDWTKTYQGGMLDVARQNANKPQIVGSAETGYFAVPNAPGQTPGQVSGQVSAPAAPRPGLMGGPPAAPPMGGQPQQPQQAPAGPTPVIPPVDRTAAQIQQREAEAKRLGLDLNDPQVRGFVLTGRRPPEQTITASDRKAIIEADEAVSTGEGVIGSLRRAKTLSKNSMGFPGAGMVATAGSLIGSPVAINTAELDNLVGTTALSQLKTIFGGNPTEGERKILLQLQGSSSKPDAVRQRIYDTAIELANRRLEHKRQVANELRNATYFRPGGGVPTSQQRQAPTPSGAPAPPPGFELQ